MSSDRSGHNRGTVERRPDDRSRGPAEEGRERFDDEAEARRRAERDQRGRMVKIVVGLVLLILFVIFIVQNSDEKTLRLIFTDVRVPLILALAGSAVVGAAITLLVGWPYRRTLKRYIRELEHERDDLEGGRRR